MVYPFNETLHNHKINVLQVSTWISLEDIWGSEKQMQVVKGHVQ